MTDDQPDLPSDRDSPVGEPVIRGDEEIMGQRATDAVRFDPSDPESLQQATEIVRAFAGETDGTEDQLYMLRGAAACAALVRGTGSYKAAAERADGDVTVSFIRKWARVHDLPRAVRIHVANGELAPTAAKHIARVEGIARYDLTWATLDHDLTVREVRALATDLNNYDNPADAFAKHGIELGQVTLELPVELYRELRRQAALNEASLSQFVADRLQSLE